MLKKYALSYTHYTLLLCSALVLLAGFVWFEQRLSSNANEQLNQAYKDAQQIIIDKELVCINLVQGLLTDTQNLQRNWSDIIELAGKKNILLTVYKNDTLLIWTDNVLNSEDAYSTIKNGAGFIQAKNGYYVTYKQTRGSYSYLFYVDVKTDYPFRNQYIENQFDPDLGFISEGFIFSQPLENFVDIHSLNNTYLFSLQIFSFTEKTPTWLIVCILFSVCLVLFSAHVLARHYIQLHVVPTTLLFWALFIYLRWLNVFFHLPEFIYDLKLFQPQIYASSAWFPSLGDLLINSMLVLWYLIILETKTSRLHPDANHIPEPKYTLPVFWIRFFCYLLLCIGSAHIAVTFIRSLTIDSQISFNINNVFTINLFTYLGLVGCIILSLSVYFISRNFIRFVQLQKVSLKWVIAITAGVFIIYCFAASLFFENDRFHTLVTVLLLSAFFTFKLLHLKLNRFQQYFVVIFAISFTSAISINHWLNIKELENRKLFAAKLVSQNDITTDYFLRNVEKKLNSDDYIVDYFPQSYFSKIAI
jgi:two-component system nitrogen regulation sensor histidine kinase NtrY